ncbi:type I restriction endonuclease subunit R [Desulfuromonas carbonis]|uniref:type I restriction endonuclease subunit R, EcoR124 family n=1 Tax=Desulfuromonas sp. DDH964 TaxID=1823759 RepID=UPI00078E4B7B|nr:HsdR family type I site-specific deoxyribonuclease [Desulfuromonas sp. DDH964]AMV73633.1 Type-1 restriction enzyme R protein [Desulfuromonas sp. DDH964]
MAEQFGLPAEVIEKIRAALARFEPIRLATLYGSRAKGTYKPGSDIDLTLTTTGELENSFLNRVAIALDDLDLPYSFDISLLAQIDNPNLLDHIRRVGTEFFNAESYAAELRRRDEARRYAEQAYQSEAQLEQSLIRRLGGLGYDFVSIGNSAELRANLKRQLEKHNEVLLTDAEFAKVLNHLDKGNVFERAKILRDRMQLTRDDGSSLYLQFLNTEHWCQNQYQVTNQITLAGSYKNRYDVTLLINGLPLVQIELKRRGMELKEAFNQVNRYHRHSFWAENGLFQYVQLFVISNGVNTKYYANNRNQDFKQTFYWADKDNNPITQLDAFADRFLEKCALSKVICKYIVLHESDKVLMVLRPYQYHAVEAIVERVKHGRKNGYIWHTTGSGKTLTSFKAAQVLTALPKVQKVIFVVDRADLDYQTTREFNYFREGSVDATSNTRALVKQLEGDNKLIVTTIQKLNNAISRKRFLPRIEALRNERIVFIFDECHRSQFGQTHKNITGYFGKAQLFGFTGTPIFAENAVGNQHGKRTTKDLFEECLHRYVITNAISDENVLRFSVEYWGKLKRKDGTLVDEQVSSIDTKAFFEAPQRIEKVVDWVIANHNRKTHNRNFSAILCVSSVDALIAYYETFKRKREKKEHDLRVVTVFTYAANEDDVDADGLIGDPNLDLGTDTPVNKHSRDKLEEFIGDYNRQYQTSFSAKDSKSFYNYYKDVARRLKERDKKSFLEKDRVDILLVVNMYLTGFDVKKLNTLYVDKNLRYHGLIQAYSRTNRTLGELKSQGNIVCFRNLKKNTDEAIALFSNPEAKEIIFIEPYERHVELFNEGVIKLMVLASTPDAVSELISEKDQLAFVRAFRQLMRLLNILKSFTEFNFADLDMDAQTFEDYKSKYLDIYDRMRSLKEEAGASIIEEVDFELELIQRDEINVAYILELLAAIQQQERSANARERKKAQQQREAVFDLLKKETQLRSKRELIEKFINDYMPDISEEQNLKEVFNAFWAEEKKVAINHLCATEGMAPTAVYQMLDSYQFTGKEPLRETVFASLDNKPKLLERKPIFERIVEKLLSIVRTFEDNVGDL